MDDVNKLKNLCAALLEACKQKDAQIAQLTKTTAQSFESILAKILAALQADGLLLPSSKQPEIYEVTYKAFQDKVMEFVPPGQRELFARWLAAFEVIKTNPNTGNLYHRAGVGKIAKFNYKLIEYLERSE